MSSTSLVGLAGSRSDLSELECEPSRSVRPMSSASASLQSTGLTSPATLMLEPSPPTVWQQTGLRLMQSAEDSPAKTFPTPDMALVLRESEAAFGRSTPVLLASYDPATSSWRTSQRCLIEGWTLFSGTLPRSGMTRNGTLWQLRTLAPLTSEIASGLLPTPRRSGQSRAWKAYKRRNYQGNLEEYLGERGFSGWITRQFVEWMMGFALNWTDTRRLETPSSHISQKPLVARS